MKWTGHVARAVRAEIRIFMILAEKMNGIIETGDTGPANTFL
jgi:hypothetical protein